MKAKWIALALLLALVVGGLGYLLGRAGPTTTTGPTTATAPAAAPQQTVYTCSMHPQIRLPQMGDCPICQMPLIPAASASGTGEGGVPTLRLSDHALAMASVQTSPVERRSLSRELRAVGRVEYNESSLATITPRVDGYAERLFVNFTGVEIRQGDHLAEVYSPELLVAQQELLIALQSGQNLPIAEVARTKLRLLGMTDAQVNELVQQKKTTDHVTLYSPISGTVIEKNIVERSAFKAGDVLYRIANLDTVWVYVDIYEYDLPWVRYGQHVHVTAEAVPGRTFEGRVTFVQPLVNDQTRTVRVPVHVENPDHVLKPGMFVTARIEAALTSEGQAAATGVEGLFSCPMHPQVMQPQTGECPICQMPLERIPGQPQDAPSTQPAEHEHHYHCPMNCEKGKTYAEPGRCPVCKMRLEPTHRPEDHGPGVLAVPASAVLDSGTRRIVYVQRERGLFEPREVTLGPRAGEFFPVLQGLEAGERVATRGGFLIDSQFQVTGHPSLLYPGGLHADVTPAPAQGEPQSPSAPPPAAHQH